MVTVTTLTTCNSAPNRQAIPTVNRYRGLLLQWLLGLTLGLCLSSGVRAADRILQDISFATLSGTQLQIVLTLSGPPPTPASFTTDSPARIAIDLPDTHIGPAHIFRQIGVGAVQSVGAAEANGRTRVVVNLMQLVPHAITVDGNRLLVALGRPHSALSTLPTEAAPPAPPSQRASTAARSIEDIDFRRGDNGEGRVIVTLSDPTASVDVHQQGNNIIVDFQGTQLPAALQRRLDVTDFATPVHTIETLPKSGNVHMVIGNVRDFEHLAYQADRIFTVEVRPMSKEQKENAKKERLGYTGERMSLNFQNIDVRAVLQLIAEFTKFNIVTSDTVQGALTLRLNDVPWDQALDIILKSKGLGMRRSNNVIMVAPTEEIAKREKAELEAEKTVVDLAPLHSELMQINYAKASDIASLLKAKENSLLSARGNVSVDERTNTLLIQDTTDKLNEVRQLVSTLDVPVRQVQIESRIVIAKDTFAKNIGVSFGATGIQQHGKNVSAVSGSLSATDTMINSAVGNMAAGTTSGTIALPSSSNRLNVSLPGSPPSGGTTPSIAFALLGSRYLLDLELSALQTESRAETIANPRVITSDQKEATIEQGDEIPYQQTAGGTSGGTAVAFKKAALTLRVKPQITPDDRILLTINLNDDAPGASTGGVPSISTKKISTEVLVNNGETLVLGGIYTQDKSHQVSRVPFLSDLPLLGNLFRDNSDSDTKSELLIFMTPRIIKQTLAIK